jgi:hypothetical protein
VSFRLKSIEFNLYHAVLFSSFFLQHLFIKFFILLKHYLKSMIGERKQESEEINAIINLCVFFSLNTLLV